ncbi:MAG: UbiA prenyltransferase family protein [Chthonomonas sp.]|nr:UbiA prenyltransferase family protein [Chthonomonas sp.]
MGAVLSLIRVRQWTKNLLVFAAWLFTAGWNTPGATQAAFLSFIALCALSSAVYVTNDLLDIESDRRHPKKRFRAIASGKISTDAATILAILLLAIGIGVGWLLPIHTMLAVFMGLQVAYNVALKHLAGVDVMTIAMAFVVRAAIGAVAIQVTISPWLLYCTGTLALFLAVAKRRHEFITLGTDGATRASLQGYTRSALDALMLLSATIAAISYGLYSIESETARAHPTLLMTVPVVVFTIIRYLLLAHGSEETDEPELLLFRDRQLMVSFVLFVVLAVAAMAGWRIGFLQVAS